jgi:hypothetical protein
MGHSGMTRDEARRLVQRFEALWPDRFWSDHRRQEWADELERHDQRTAVTAVERLRGTEKHCPSIADFRACCRSVQGGIPTPSAPQHDVAGPEFVAAALADCRARLDAARTAAPWRKSGWRAQRKDPA